MKQQYSYQITLKPVSEAILDHAPKLQAKNLNWSTSWQGITCSHYRHWRVYTFEPRWKLSW